MHALSTFEVVWEIVAHVGDVSELIFIADVFLVHNREFKAHVIDEIHDRALACGQVELTFGKSCLLVLSKERMLLVKADFKIVVSYGKYFDDGLTLGVCLFPRINKMKNIVVWKLEPDDFIVTDRVSLHDSIPCRFLKIKVVKKLLFSYGEITPDLKRQVWEYDIALCDCKIMNHPRGRNLDSRELRFFSLRVECRIVDIWLKIGVAECEKLASSHVYLGMRSNVVR